MLRSVKFDPGLLLGEDYDEEGMNNKMDPNLLYGILISSISRWSEGLMISLIASTEKVDEVVDKVVWPNPDLSRGENKHIKKELGSVRFSYLKVIKELTIIGIAKGIEDLIFDLKEIAGIKFKIWDPGMDLRFHNDVKCIRNLNNAIKHSRGVILDNNQKGNRSLIDDYGYKPNSEIEWIKINLEEMIIKAYVFQLDVISQITGHELEEELKDEGNDLNKYVKDMLIPEILRE